MSPAFEATIERQPQNGTTLSRGSIADRFLALGWTLSVVRAGVYLITMALRFSVAQNALVIPIRALSGNYLILDHVDW